MPSPEIAVILSTYQSPAHLRRSLLSIALQWGVRDGIEVVVSDDGSMDETSQVIEEFARSVEFPVKMTSHPHAGFRLAQSRNEGVAASSAPYLLFTDGDCLLPPNHLACHIAWRRDATVMAGDCYRLDEAATARMTEQAIRDGAYLHWVTPREKRRIAVRALRAELYSLLRLRTYPRLTGSNIGMWRADFERVNGFDQNYVGWGLEDRDLQMRLSRLGIRFRSILRQTAVYHLWHPRHPTATRNNVGTPNLRYYQRPGRLTRCRNGLAKRADGELVIDTIGELPPELLSQELRGRASRPGERPDVEILVFPGAGRFTGRADCNILVILDDHAAARGRLPKADIVVTDRQELCRDGEGVIRFAEFGRTLRAVA